jgi:hypothetical protein
MEVTTTLQGGGDGVKGGGLEAGVVVFGNNKGGHFVFLIVQSNEWLK